MTFDINPWYGITVKHGQKIGLRKWRAEAYIFRRDNQKRIGGDFYGEGGAMTTADDVALNEAKHELHILSVPDDWSGPENGYN